MDKLYFADFYFYICPTCRQQSMEKKIFAVYDKAEIGAARKAGLLKYCCSRCKATHSSASVFVNGEVVEITEREAKSGKIDFESKGSA